MTSNTTPLTTRQLDDPFAYVEKELKTLKGVVGMINTQTFLNHVSALAALLPKNKTHLINLCSNRYLFTVTLCAAVLSNQTNLLPSNKNTSTQKRLAERYSDSYVVHNGDCQVTDDLYEFDLLNIALDTNNSACSIPQIPSEHIAAISFTSGSTGDAKPNIKTWETFFESTLVNSRYMLSKHSCTQYLLATVPAQHMWGLETSVLMSLFSNVCVLDSKPLFPHDIKNSLEMMPEPRILVSTPVHLRALISSDLEYSKLDTVLCATSPLTTELAHQVEQRFNAQLREVYGCSEIGSMAVRKTAQDNIWERFDAIHFKQQEDSLIVASTNYISATAVLGDFIEELDNTHFILKGRTDDMIDIAGKRGSLNEINKILLSFNELIDGIVFFPPQERAVPRLVSIVVLPSHITKKQLSDHFRTYLDPAFIPRPIILTDKLPREENGKLPKQSLLSLYKELIA